MNFRKRSLQLPHEEFSFPGGFTNNSVKMVICDFNCPSRSQSTLGILADKLMGNQSKVSQMHDSCLSSDAKLPSSFNSSGWRRGYNPELVFASNHIVNQCEKIVLDQILNSQHQPIGIEVHAVVTPRVVHFRRCFNLKKANWGKFSADLDATIKDLPAFSTNSDAFVEKMKRSPQELLS